MTAGPCEPADTLAVERVVLARRNVAWCGPRWPLLPTRRSHARFSARIGPNATSEAELFRSPCERISLLVHERFCPVHGSHSINRGRGDATTRPPARGRADFQSGAGSFSLTFSRGGACRDHTWSRDYISSPARGHRVSRGGDNRPWKCLEFNVTDSPE